MIEGSSRWFGCLFHTRAGDHYLENTKRGTRFLYRDHSESTVRTAKISVCVMSSKVSNIHLFRSQRVSEIPHHYDRRCVVLRGGNQTSWLFVVSGKILGKNDSQAIIGTYVVRVPNNRTHPPLVPHLHTSKSTHISAGSLHPGSSSSTISQTQDFSLLSQIPDGCVPRGGGSCEDVGDGGVPLNCRYFV